MLEIDRTALVFAARPLQVAPGDFDRLYGKMASFMSGPGAKLPGIAGTQLFCNVGRTRLSILVPFRSYMDWVRARWDAHLGELEEIDVNLQTLGFDLYGGDRFVMPRLSSQQSV